MPARRNSWQVFTSVVFALLIRELKTRFGKWRLGYVWAVLEPILSVAVLALVITYLRGRSPWFGIPVPVFVALGFLLLDFFKTFSIQAVGAISSNRALMGYRQVRPFTTLAARALLELLVFLLVIIILAFVAQWIFGWDVVPYDPLRTLLVLALLFIFAFGMGLMFAVLGALQPEVAKVVPLLNRPLLFISCVMFPLASVPANLRPYLLWNPLVHAIEQIRLSMFPYYPADGTSIFYLASCALIALGLGMLIFTAKRQKLIMT